jgi:hypothetical protein
MGDAERASELRARGLSWRAIDAAMGRRGRNGNWSWRLLRGGDGAGHPAEPPGFLSSISLWKAVAGGRSFREVRAALASRGIACEKGDASPWEDRYEVLVAGEDREAAEDLLFTPVPDAAFRAQSLDALKDPTR